MEPCEASGWKPLLESSALWTGYEGDHALNVSRAKIEQFVLPILEMLQVRRVLEVGCGNGIGPFVLRGHGYNAFGLDPHFDRAAIADHDFLCKGTGEALPYDDNSFELVYSLETIEHVGSLDGMLMMAPDHRAIRQRFIQELCRVASKYVVITTPNRLFPVDEHRTNRYGNPSLRFHSPFEDKTLSADQLSRMFSSNGFRLERYLDPTGYYRLERIQRMLGNWGVSLAQFTLKMASNRLLGRTPLNPHLFLLYRRRNE
jgi:SAM-dependent methyltransferase